MKFSNIIRKMNKKGAELAIGTIVLIILALVVLVVIIYGFTIGWGNLFQNILGFGGGQVNVQTVVQSCKVACSTQSAYDYCKRSRNVVFDEGEKAVSLTCFDLERRNVGLDSCASVDCVISERGVCDGTIIPKVCNDQNNRGQSNCELVPNCIWTSGNDPTNPNIGNCNPRAGLTCADFNNDKDSCIIFGCNWQ